VPGRETLFEGFFRLLPGEELCWDASGLRRRQRHTLADLEPASPDGDPVEAVEQTFTEVLRDCARVRPDAANLLSGGIDSSYLQAIWNRVAGGDGLPASYCVSVDHPMTWPDTDYAVTASRWLGTRHVLDAADEPYADYLARTLAETAEPPNHVQSAYFGHLARVMAGRGHPTGICGEGGDSLFGLGLANQVHNAALLRRLVPGRATRGLAAATCAALGWDGLARAFRLSRELRNLAHADHPVNRVAAFTDVEAITACFGTGAVEAAAAGRRELLDLYAVPDDPMQRLHATGFLAEAMDSASLWATLFARAGGDLLCPFLDSRVIRLALGLPAPVRFPFRRPKELLKRALARYVPPSMARRAKLGFGQPVFEWLDLGGQLRPLVDQIARYDFLDAGTMKRLRERPTWFLYSLLCYDLWHKMFIDRRLPWGDAYRAESGAAVAPAARRET
jgi:asparagine synthase (glutamine-hydrolysing)